jgi:low affinity Fe/Cu permease
LAVWALVLAISYTIILIIGTYFLPNYWPKKENQHEEVQVVPLKESTNIELIDSKDGFRNDKK